MEKLIIQIGASSNHFGGFAVNVDGVYGAGNTVEECKTNILEGLDYSLYSRNLNPIEKMGKVQLLYENRITLDNV